MGTMVGGCQPYQARRGNGHGAMQGPYQGYVANLTC